MSYNIQEAVEEWVLFLSQSEVDDCLSRLEMKRQGTLFKNLDRLSKWVLGLYAPQDFQASAGPDDAIARRKRLREDLLRRLLKEEDGTFLQTSKWDVHPLEVVLASEQILGILQKTTAEAALGTSERQHLEAAANEQVTRDDDNPQPQQQDRRNSRDEDKDDGEDSQSDGSEHQPQPGEMIRLLASDGSEFSVPREFSTLLAELIVKVKSLEDLVLDQHRRATSSNHIADRQGQAASSTHIAEHRTGHNVQFEDTYTVHGNDTWNDLPPTPPPARRVGQADLRGVNPAWVGGDRRSSARGSSWLNQSTPGETGNFSRSSTFHSRDIGQVVRKWQIRFSGAKSQSIDVFLARLEDCRVLANLSEEEVLSSLSELFTDTAATWYRNEKEKWATWQDFLTAARRWYGTTKRYQQRLVAEANNRTQGADEAVRDYITCLIAIVRKISPPPSVEQQLDQLHRNLRPQLQAMVRRTDFSTVEGLLELAVDAEQTLENAKTFRPPPLPTAALLPEMAYKPFPLTDSQKKPKSDAKDSKVAAVGGKDTKYEDLEQMLRRVLKQSLSELGSPRAESSGKNTPAGPRRGRGYQPSGRNETKKSSDPKTEAKAPSQQNSSAPTPSSGVDAPKEPRPPLSCYSCGLPGFIARFCPNCSGNGKRDA